MGKNRDTDSRGITRATAVALALVFWAGIALAQDTPREVRAKANIALSQGAYADAIGFLQQLVEWFGQSTDQSTVTDMGPVYFNLGICHFLMGQFAEARTAFEVYLKKYRNGARASEAAVYIADAYRFDGGLDKALKAYDEALKRYGLGPDLEADVYAGMIRCHLAQDQWDRAMPLLKKLYDVAPDLDRRSWAATFLTTAYMKEMRLENVYRLVPYLLLPDSFASRSVALNMSALEAGDLLFGEEKYRDALWVYRLVYPHDTLVARSEIHLDVLQKRSERLKKTGADPRRVMRIQERIGELEAEIKALSGVENYDIELFYRIARAYMEIFRYREAQEMFVYLYGQAEGRRAEEALYLAFECATRVQPWDRAFELGDEYAKVYPGGEFYDRVSLMTGQMYAKLENWAKVIETLTKALEVSPRHEEAAECMFLVGYAHFMEERFGESVTWLRRMNSSYPGNPRQVDGSYWTGMGLMFDRKFDEAAPAFDDVIEAGSNSAYRVDAAFRRAVCDFGRSRYREAETRLSQFVGQHPDSKLCGEAYMMLGDISGVFGELPRAVVRYQQVLKQDTNIEFYNHAAFRCGEILEEMRDFAGMVRHFKDYIQANREGCNVPLAIYWVGSAMWSMGEKTGAIEYYRQAVERYGNRRGDLGIDMILDEWIGRGKKLDTNSVGRAWQDLEELERRASQSGQAVLSLRLKRVFLYQSTVTPERKKALLDDIVRAESITNASPGVLELMLDEAEKRGDRALAMQVADATIREFPETDYALAARMFIARDAMAALDFKTAVKHLSIIKEVYATSGEAADALMMLGAIHLKQNQYAEADACYSAVLNVREWRGPMWPEALYGRGECARLQRRYEEACAFYERIYVMYRRYTLWVGKAYLARAECLARMQQYNQAADTLSEMIASPELKDAPEVAEAQKRLEALRSKL